MNLAGKIIPTAATLGLGPMLTQYFMLAAVFAFLATAVFCLSTKNDVEPEHRSSQVTSALICGVAGFSYLYIYFQFKEVLSNMTLVSPADYPEILRRAFSSAGQTRYVDWLITTPLLLLKICFVQRLKPRDIKGTLALLLVADVLMILTGYVGEQQLASNGEILAGSKNLWGILSTAFYVIVALTLYTRIWPRSEKATGSERRAFKLIAATVFTTWGVYPLGYALTVWDPQFNASFVQVAFTLADILNKVGPAVVVYLAAAEGSKFLRAKAEVAI